MGSDAVSIAALSGRPKKRKDLRETRFVGSVFSFFSFGGKRLLVMSSNSKYHQIREHTLATFSLYDK
jgi:hypothetical protein